MFLFTDKDLAVEWVENRKTLELNNIKSQIYQLEVEIEKVNQQYSGVTYEDKIVFQTT